MAHEKLFTAKEAALAVLKKTEELLKSSKSLKKDAPASGQTLGGAIGYPGVPTTAPIKKSDMPAKELHPKEKEQAPADHVEHTNKDAVPVNKNPEWGTDPTVKGHFKLAKFLGHMEAKRKGSAKTPEMDKGETGHEKGINTHGGTGSFTADNEKRGSALKGGANLGGVSVAGEASREKSRGGSNGFGAKETHRAVLDEMKAMPKPKLPG